MISLVIQSSGVQFEVAVLRVIVHYIHTSVDFDLNILPAFVGWLFVCCWSSVAQ
mgnify:FL=1